MCKKSSRIGRPPTTNPAKYKYEFRLTAEENKKFKDMVAKSGKKRYSDFIRAKLFSEDFRVITSDENTLKIYNELQEIRAKIDKIGVAYNSYIATLRHHFTERRAAEVSRRNAKLLGEILHMNERALYLNEQVLKRQQGL